MNDCSSAPRKRQQIPPLTFRANRHLELGCEVSYSENINLGENHEHGDSGGKMGLGRVGSFPGALHPSEYGWSTRTCVASVLYQLVLGLRA